MFCSLTPAGRIVLHDGDDSTSLPSARAKRIRQAFQDGPGFGILHLGAAETETELHPTLGFFRDLGRSLVARACSEFDPGVPEEFQPPAVDEKEVEAVLLGAPPMQGAELLDVRGLAELWDATGAALAARAAEHRAGFSGYLGDCDSNWNIVGRVCFHLAENRRDPDYPFAFIATYARSLSNRTKDQVRHIPLARALQEYSGAGEKKKLLALLSPLMRAAERSELMRELVDSGDVYHPLAWTANDAHRFLREVQSYEQAGMVVRMPDWWQVKNPPRPRVSVSVGKKSPSLLGMDALLDFDVNVTLDGQKLTAKEVQSLLAANAGLTLIKGKWVEVDTERLSKLLEHWQSAQVQTGGGVGFAEAMRMLAGAPIEAGASDLEDPARPEWSEVVAGKWLTKKLDALRDPSVARTVQAGAGLKAQLRPYQQLGVQWLWSLRSLQLGGCLADDMGLGKTIQVIAILAMQRGKKPAGSDLLVVPASLIANWQSEIERFAPKLRVLIAHPSHIKTAELKKLTPADVEGYDAVITSYGTVVRAQWMQTFAWRSVILDEAQAIKNPGAKQTRAIKRLNAVWRLALTGTPVENRVGDLWSIFDFINPGLLGTPKAFTRFCQSLASGDRPDYAPLRRLVGPYILRRLKTDKAVITDLPDKTEVTTHCLLSKEQAVLYQASVKEMKKLLADVDDDRIQRRGVVLAFLMRFKQICNHPSQWLGDGAYDPAASGKFARLRLLCDPMAARQDKVLVFTQFREMTAPLATFLAEVFGKPGLVLHGGTAVKRRQGLVKRFQSDEDVPFMVLSLKAGGTGLNLTAASHVVHFDRWWNPAVENQATDRAFRIGQKRNVLVHKFVCRGTVEERIDELIQSKRALSDDILSGGAESALTEMSNEELLAMARLDLNSALQE